MKMSTLGTYTIFDQKFCLACGNDLQTPQVLHVSTLAWRIKSVGSDIKYWPPLETAVSC